jgi:hypothetical protein
MKRGAVLASTLIALLLPHNHVLGVGHRKATGFTRIGLPSRHDQRLENCAIPDREGYGLAHADLGVGILPGGAA